MSRPVSPIARSGQGIDDVPSSHVPALQQLTTLEGALTQPGPHIGSRQPRTQRLGQRVHIAGQYDDTRRLARVDAERLGPASLADHHRNPARQRLGHDQAECLHP